MKNKNVHFHTIPNSIIYVVTVLPVNRSYYRRTNIACHIKHFLKLIVCCFQSELQFGHTPPDPDATYELCDRIVNVREGHSVPLGAKGTIIGIRTIDDNDKLYDVVFDNPFLGGLALNCSNGRGYRLPPVAMINISYGNRVYQNKTGVPG